MTYRPEDLPKEELTALYDIARAGGEAVKDPLYHYALIRAKRCRKARQDAATDARRRILVGARLPREEAWLIARAAGMEGLSLYAFCRKTLVERARAITNIDTFHNDC